MSAQVPQNFVQADGQASVNAGQINTFVQSTVNVDMLRGFIGLDGMQILLEGTVSLGDGGQGTFAYVSTSSATDDNGITCVKPNAAGPTGRWIRLPVVIPSLRTMVYVIDGGADVISTGVLGQTMLTFPAAINAVYLLADQPGSIQIDIWKVAFGGYPPTGSNSICAADLPTITSAQEYQDTTLTGWTTAILANDTFMFNVVSVTSIQRVTIILALDTTESS